MLVSASPAATIVTMGTSWWNCTPNGTSDAIVATTNFTERSPKEEEMRMEKDPFASFFPRRNVKTQKMLTTRTMTGFTAHAENHIRIQKMLWKMK